MLEAVRHHQGKTILLAADDNLRADREIMLECVQQDGNCLRFASSELRSDKELVLAAVTNKPEALKFALEGLTQDKDCLIAAGILWDQYPAKNNTASTRKIVLSTRFSLDEDSTPTATQFTVLWKEHPYFQRSHTIYSPNAVSKATCDPQWTDWDWHCRGTKETCQMDINNTSDDPFLLCCWRYSFRQHLEQAHNESQEGFMLANCGTHKAGRHFTPMITNTDLATAKPLSETSWQKTLASRCLLCINK